MQAENNAVSLALRSPVRSSVLAALASWLVAGGCSAVPAAPTTQAEPTFRGEEVYVVHTAVGVGLRAADAETRLGDIDSPMFGVEVDTYRPSAPVGYEVGLSGGIDDDAKAWEGYLGLRKTWDGLDVGLTPYVGAGASYVSVDPDATNRSRIRSYGGYAHAGVYWPIDLGSLSWGAPVVLGVDLRTLVGDDYDYVEGRVFLGVGNP